MRLDVESLPPVYRPLLDHAGEMTRTLEHHGGDRLVVRVLATWRNELCYGRRVLLVQEVSRRPMLMATLHVRLDVFAPAVRDDILAGQIPFGRILRTAGCEWHSVPRCFFAVTPRPEMRPLFGMSRPMLLYGRDTDVVLAQEVIGTVTEVLPPLEPAPTAQSPTPDPLAFTAAFRGTIAGFTGIAKELT